LVKGWYLNMVETIPGATAPTDNYDIVINNASGADVMGGALANRDATLAEQVAPLLGGIPTKRPINSDLSIVLTGNSVNAATGTIKLFFGR